MTLPHRPRLRASVAARRHLDASGQARVELRAPRRGLVATLDERHWRLLEHADGTRDLDALCLALAADGAYESEAEARAILERLDAADLLDDGLPAPRRAPPLPTHTTPADRAVEPLPGYALTCDGSGSCCESYGSPPFTRLEAMRAELAAAPMTLPLEVSAAFTPARGAQMRADGPRAVALVEDRCAFLEPSTRGRSRCGLHRLAGPEHKPLACRTFPRTFVDDGVRIRASVAPECVCAFRSAGEASSAEASDAIPLGVPIIALRTPVAVSSARVASVDELRSWSAALTASLAEPVDGVQLALTLTEEISAHGLTTSIPCVSGERATTPLEPWITQLRDAAEAATDPAASGADASQFSRRIARWTADALADVPATLLLEASDEDRRDEAFYLRALAHGHRLAVGGRDLSDALKQRASRLLAARAMRRSPPRGPLAERIAASVPLALLEAATRNLGLDARPT